MFDPFEEPHEFKAAGFGLFDPFPCVWNFSSLARFGPEVCGHVVDDAEGLSDVERDDEIVGRFTIRSRI